MPVPARTPSTFRSIEPAWNDQNLREISRAVRSPLFFTHVRAAGGPPIQQTNCHPFRYENWLFMHNGVISQFALTKRDLTFAVDPVAVPAHPRHDGLRGAVPPRAHARTGRRPDQGDGRRDPAWSSRPATRRECSSRCRARSRCRTARPLWAFRYSSQGQSRTLFHSAHVPTLREMYPDAERLSTFGDHAQVVVSEPLNDLPGVFLEVPESTVAILDPSGYHHEAFLAA